MFDEDDNTSKKKKITDRIKPHEFIDEISVNRDYDT